MAVIKFTDIGIRALPEGVYFDEKTPAFGIRVGKSRKTWIVLKGPNRTKVRIGHYPEISLADARKLALVALGTPIIKSSSPTFAAARTEYFGQAKWRERTRYEVERSLSMYFGWTKAIDQITHRDVAEAIDAIEAPAEALHAFNYVRTFFNWCVPRYLKSSPCQGLKPPGRYIPRERVLSDEELKKVWVAAGDMGSYGALIRACIATGMRVGELQKFRPTWLTKDAITIPGECAKNGRAVRLPITKRTRALLPLITHGQPTQGKTKKRLDAASGVTGWTLHDLRRTFATKMQALGVRLEVTERLLNHISGTQSGIVAVYQRHDFWPEMVDAVAKYEQFLIATVVKPEKAS